MVKRLAAIAALLLAVLVFGPVALGHAQPPAGDPGTSETGQAPADDDMYAGCRDVGDSVPVVGGFLERFCDLGTAVANPQDAAGEFADGMWKSGVGKAAEVFLDGWKKGITFMLTWWMTNSVTGAVGNSDTENTVWQVHQFLRIFQIAAFMISVGISALKLAWAKSRLAQQHAEETAMMLTRTVFASWTLVPLILAGDELSRAAGVWLVQAMVGENIDEAANKLLAVAEVGPLLGPGLIFVFAILGIVGTAVQAVFIMMQIAMLRLVLGWAPIAAAASGIGSAGMQAWTKLRNWAVVFALFPFVASSVYGIAFLSAAGATDAQGVFAGMILLTLSCLTMPALARLIVPAMGSMAGGNGGAVLGGMLAATGASMGASMIQSMSSSAEQDSGSSSSSSVQGGPSTEPTGSSTPSSGSSSPAPRAVARKLHRAARPEQRPRAVRPEQHPAAHLEQQHPVARRAARPRPLVLSVRPSPSGRKSPTGSAALWAPSRRRSATAPPEQVGERTFRTSRKVGGPDEHTPHHTV
ncbi:hypothetical protein EN35_23225 [Rhodococcus qingshengii]|nr:hypothetical protein EN35_23225 [Rhodococcus qingshengii]